MGFAMITAVKGEGCIVYAPSRGEASEIAGTEFKMEAWCYDFLLDTHLRALSKHSDWQSLVQKYVRSECTKIASWQHTDQSQMQILFKLHLLFWKRGHSWMSQYTFRGPS